jgi:DNA-binding LytR/AlgR family response regulator
LRQNHFSYTNSVKKMVTALIAEDEPLLAAALKAELARAWPALQVVAVVGDGASAVAQALALQPDVLFFDIQMPGMSGLDAAAELLDAWPLPTAGSKPFPALVFVTAFDQYAVAAFEAQAMDYLLKPVQPARLLKTIQKVQLAQQIPAQAAIKSVVSTDTQLEQTLAQLDSNTFWQIHRGTVVRATAIHTVRRDEQGKLTVTLHGNPDKLAVSRIYSHLFKAM